MKLLCCAVILAIICLSLPFTSGNENAETDDPKVPDDLIKINPTCPPNKSCFTGVRMFTDCRHNRHCKEGQQCCAVGCGTNCLAKKK